MNNKLTTLCLSGFFALTLFVARPLLADDWNKRTEFQFSAPVQVPGQTLAAGKYVFELADTGADRNIVQIYSEDSSGREILVTTLQTIPEHTSTTPDKPVIRLEERTSGSPEAIHSWFYTGENTGWEFVYPSAPAAGAE